MAIEKKPVNTYIEKIVARSNHKDKSARHSLAGLSESELPYETEQRLIELWGLPKSYKEDIFWHDLRVIGLLAEVQFELAVLPSAHELKRLFLSECGEDCLKIFMREMGYIIALYRFLLPRPTKSKLESTAKYVIKELGKHLAGIEECLDYAHKQPQEWIYIKEMLIEAYHDAKANRGQERDRNITPSAAIHFFDTARWMNLACQRIGTSQAKPYKAHGRKTENRNKALIALASSYELCFGEEPTGANDGGFDKCARVFLQCVRLINCESGKDKIADDTVTSLIKATIRRYRKIRENRIQEWRCLR